VTIVSELVWQDSLSAVPIVGGVAEHIFFKPWNKTFQITPLRGSTFLDQHLQKCGCFCKKRI